MTISVVFARALLAEVHGHGIDPQAFLQACQLEPARLDDLTQMLRLDEADRLTSSALRLTGDPGPGLALGVTAPLSMLQIFGHLVLAQPNLRLAFAVLTQYSSLLAEGFRWQLT